MRSSRTTASFCSRRQDEGTLALPGVTASAQDHDESPARGNKRSSPTETLAVGHVTVLWGGDDLIGRMKELAKTQTIHRPPTAERIAQELVETIREQRNGRLDPEGKRPGQHAHQSAPGPPEARISTGQSTESNRHGNPAGGTPLGRMGAGVKSDTILLIVQFATNLAKLQQ